MSILVNNFPLTPFSILGDRQLDYFFTGFFGEFELQPVFFEEFRLEFLHPLEQEIVQSGLIVNQQVGQRLIGVFYRIGIDLEIVD